MARDLEASARRCGWTCGQVHLFAGWILACSSLSFWSGMFSGWLLGGTYHSLWSVIPAFLWLYGVPFVGLLLGAVCLLFSCYYLAREREALGSAGE